MTLLLSFAGNIAAKLRNYKEKCKVKAETFAADTICKLRSATNWQFGTQ